MSTPVHSVLYNKWNGRNVNKQIKVRGAFYIEFLHRLQLFTSTVAMGTQFGKKFIFPHLFRHKKDK